MGEFVFVIGVALIIGPVVFYLAGSRERLFKLTEQQRDKLAAAHEQAAWQRDRICELQSQNAALTAQLNNQWTTFAESLYQEKP